MPACLRFLLLAATVLLGAPTAALAQAPASDKPADQVVVPQVQRREVKLPRIPNKDFEVGAFLGTYATQNFGANLVGGLRLGYHITEDFFVEGSYGQSKVSDETFSVIYGGGGPLNSRNERLSYVNLSLGVNLLPGEVFIGRNLAKATSVYLIGGLGSTKFNDQRKQTFNLGLGLRLYLRDHLAVQVDMRDHIYKIDLLGKLQRTQNLELTAGVAYYF